MEYTISFTFTTDEAAQVLDDVIGMVLEEHEVPAKVVGEMKPEMVDLVATRAIRLLDQNDFSHKKAMLSELLAQALIAVAEERAGR